MATALRATRITSDVALILRTSAATTGALNVTDNTTYDYGSSYSPSGKKIAYSGKDGPNGDFEIYTIKPGGGGRFNVTDNGTGDYLPSWGSS